MAKKKVSRIRSAPPRGDSAPATRSARGIARRIHPIVMYPFSQPDNYDNLKALYDGLIRSLANNKTRHSASLAANHAEYARPITVMNRQTWHNNARFIFNEKRQKEFLGFRRDYVEKYSHVLDAWSVDTCQMWLHAFGYAYDHRKSGEDVYWLIPGDFDYASPYGQDVIKNIEQIPEAVMNGDQDLCVGQISVGVNSSKQLIDTYGTYGLLYNWFPHEAQIIRKITDKPRSEFFALRHSFLRELLQQRWFAYEQTIVILLHGVHAKKRIHQIDLGKISDLPTGRDTLAAAMQQVERTERVLKLFWRDRNHEQTDWPDRFRKLDFQSEQIRAAAMIVLQNLLR